jgi:hypothetical protein
VPKSAASGPQHADALAPAGVTSLQVVLSFSGDFLEFVFNLFRRRHRCGCHSGCLSSGRSDTDAVFAHVHVG